MLRDLPVGDDALSSLLSILNDNNLKPGSSIMSVTNAKTIDLLRTLLSRDDFISVAERLGRASDIMNLLEFALHVLRCRYLSSSDPIININQRARRFMFKIISKTPVMLRSFVVTGVSMPGNRNYIGFGGYSNVLKGEFRGAVVALKVLCKHDANNLAFCREALMWGSLGHKFVLPFIGIHKENGIAFLVSPYMNSGTLAQWRKNTNPSIAQITERILEVAQGMEYIHSEGVVHGDLRGENVLLDDAFHVQIADFGLTRVSDATRTRSGAMHPNFAAPELFGSLEDGDDPSADDLERTQMSDVYAFGCIYYQIHYDRYPFGRRHVMNIMILVCGGKRPPRRDEPPLSDEAWELIQQCWVMEPPNRPRMEDVAEQMMVIFKSLRQEQADPLISKLEERKRLEVALTLPPDVPDLTNDVFHNDDISCTFAGGTNDVWFCLLNTSGGPSRVMVKKQRGGPSKEKIMVRFFREVNVWYQLQKEGVHPYITPLLGVVDILHENRRPGIVLPYYEYNDVLSFIQGGNFSESKKGEIVLNIAKGLEHMHDRCNAIHGDMKLRNIFFDNRGLPKIGGFDLSQIMDTPGFTTDTYSLTVPYAAPEMLEKSLSHNDDASEEPLKITSKEADIYAFAILSAEIFMEEIYFVTRKNNPFIIYQRIMQDKRPSEEKVNSQKYFPLLGDCWKTNPAERLRISQIISALVGIERYGAYSDPRSQT